MHIVKQFKRFHGFLNQLTPLIFIFLFTFCTSTVIKAAGGGEVDENTPTLTVSPSSIHIEEGDSGTKTVSITIKLNECPNLYDIKLRYATRNNSARTQNNDYVAKSGNIVFSAGGSSCQTTVNVKVNGDNNEEADEKFYFDVFNNNTNSNQKFNPNPNKGLTDRVFRTTIYIDDEDTPPPPTVTGADLNIIKYTDPSNKDTYDIDEPITFKIVAKNQGPADSKIKVTDLLPSGMVLDSISDNVSSQFSCSGGANISCTGNHIFGVNESVTITVVAHSSTAASYRNVAVVSDKNGNQDTIDTSDNSDYEDIVVAPGGRNTVTIEKELLNSSATYAIGDTVEFELTVTNHGLDKRIALRDKFPLANTSNPNGQEWGTTFGAFELIGISEQPSDVTCENKTHNSNPYIFCYTDGDYTHNQSFRLKVQAKVLRANRICNRAHGYEYYWYWKDSDQVCLDTAGNNPPVLAALGDQVVTIGDNVGSFSLSAYDPDGDALVYSVSGLPDGLSLNTATGVITGTPSDSNTLGPRTVTVTVTDQPTNGSAPLSDTKSFQITVLYPEIHAYDDTINMETNSVKNFNVLKQGQDDEGYQISVTSYTPATFAEGTLTLRNVDGRFKFEPIEDFLGTVEFDYTITDSRGYTDTGHVTINVSTDFSDDFADFVLINPEDTRNILGNYAIAGNTIECISDSKTDFDGTCTDNQNLISNDFVTKYIDIDEDDSTWNSSSSSITIPSQFDKDDKGILWAALFWQGRYTKDAGTDGLGGPKLIRYGKNRSNGNGYVIKTAVTSDNIKKFNANNIKLKIDSGAYNDVTATTLHSHRSEGGVSYAAFADVTNEVKSAITQDGVHTFTVANLSTAEGYEIDPGLYGGWSIVVIYAETNRGKARNISVYSGYDQISNDAGERSTELTISGFKLPLFNKINSTLALFSGEGEYPLGKDAGDYDRVLLSNNGTQFRYPNNTIQSNSSSHDEIYDNIFDAKLSNIARDDFPYSVNELTQNNTGVDIDFMDVSDVMTTYRDSDQNISSVNIKWETNYDTVNPSMMVFSAELYIPKLCYDYSYKQNGITFSEDNNGTEKAYIRGERLSSNDPITVELFIRNEEASDATLKDVTFDIYDINASQAVYEYQSTYVTYPDNFTPTQIDDALMNVAPSHINDIPLGDIAANDSLYIDYDIGLVDGRTEIDMPLDGRMNFTLRLGAGINYDLSIYLESMRVCGDDRYAYYPNYDIFNIQDKALSSDTSADNYYDLPTQIVNRVGDYNIRAYENDMETSKRVTTLVGVELIDAGKYHDVNASCFEPDNTLSPRVWMSFEDNVTNVDFTEATIQAAIDAGRTSAALLSGQDTFTDPSQFYDKARENVAFRLSYLRLNDEGNILQLEERRNGCPGGKTEPCYSVTNFPSLSAVDLGNGPGNCIVSMANGRDKIPEYCGSTALIDGDQLPECLECLYGSNIQYVCSRDNFAMRPKSFRITLSDQNQTDNTQAKTIIGQNIDTTQWNLVTGYDYYIDINATNFIDDTSTPGYFAYFDQGGEDGNRSFGLLWQDISGHTACSDTEDANSTTQFYNGAANLDVSHDQIGRYHLSMVDKTYTQVDWNPNYMGHQRVNHFLSGIDCESGSSISQPEGTATGISDPDLSAVNGCEIASDLTSDLTYSDMVTQFYPYTFNQSALAVSSGPTNKSLIYIDSPSTAQSENTAMSYNFIGTYFAAGYNGTQKLTNFTDGCWAEDTQMQLDFTYNSPEPAADKSPYLSYSLQDTNTTDGSLIYRPASGTGLEIGTHDSISTPFAIDQAQAFYDPEMGGAITMDLGFNFMRENDNPLNPRFITFNDFNITYKNNPTTLYADGESSYEIKGSMAETTTGTFPRNVTFLYGRAKPSKTLYDDITGDSVITPISTIAYCDLGLTECQNRGFPLLDAQTDQSDWWLNLAHVSGDDDGNVTLVMGSGLATVAPTTLDISTGATDGSVTVTKDSGAPVPMTATIDLDTGTDKWLIYNPYSATAWPSPFYRVRFIGVSDWAGHGDTGHVVGGTTNIKKNQRLGW